MKRINNILAILAITILLLNVFLPVAIATSETIETEENKETETNELEDISYSEDETIEDGEIIADSAEEEILEDEVTDTTEKNELEEIEETTITEESITNEEITVEEASENNEVTAVEAISEDIEVTTAETISEEDDATDPSIEYSTHVQNIGWQSYVQDGKMAGTTDQSLRLEAIKISVQGLDEDISIKYQVHIQNIGWQSWKYDGELAGTTDQSLRLEAIRINLEDSDNYTIMYRVHIQNIGWQEWKTDGEMAGTTDQSLRLEAIQIKIVSKQEKGTLCLDTPSNGSTLYTTSTINVQGWKMANVSNTTIKAYIDNTQISSDEITYYNRSDVTSTILNYGTATQNPKAGFSFSIDSSSLSSGTHTIKIVLYSGDTHLKTLSSTFTLDKDLHVSYRSHVQNVGWQSYMQDGELSGTTNQSLRLEAININLENAPSDAKIKYKVHVQNIGWQDWVQDGQLAGTTDQSLRIEAIQIQLENMEDYTVEYRVHVQDVGWTDWYIDGETAGTVGQSKRIEAIQIRIVSNYKRHYIGIDVSRWQEEIDYDTLVASGEIDFIIARVGWYSESKSAFQVDAQFERNYAQAKANNIPLGAYIYSYATSVEEAKTEAEQLIAYLQSTGQTDFDLPIFYDIEDSSQISLGKDVITDMAIVFCDTLAAAGFSTGVYSYSYWLNNYMDLSRLSSDYSLWVADYGSNNTGSLPEDLDQYASTHDIWQYTDKGTVSGISGYVDMNVCYKKY